MGVRRHYGVAVVAALAATAIVFGTPGAGSAGPSQEDASDEEHAARSDSGRVPVDVDVADGTAADVAGALADIEANVAAQLSQLETSQAALSLAVAALAEKDAAVANTHLAIEEHTKKSDQVVINAFISPPAADALEVFSAESAYEATMKQTLLDMQADLDAGELESLEEARQELERLQDEQTVLADEAAAVRGDAEAALADLEDALLQQTEFVRQVQERITTGQAEYEALLQSNPALAQQVLQRQEGLVAQLAALAEAEEQKEALAALDENERRMAMVGIMVCPVQGTVRFTDTWGAARSGGRSHKGTDMMAATGTPTVAPVSGEVVHKRSSLGGLTWYLYGDDENTYYGAHLSAYENEGVGWVQGGTTIGYVGDTGNARGNPHLHMEIHPGGGVPQNPYNALVKACPDH